MKTKLAAAVFLCALNTQSSAFTKADQLLNAIESGNVTLVDSLMHHGVDPNLNISNYDTMLLMHAVDTSNVDIVENLIKHFSKVDVEDKTGTTPLIYSVKTNKQEIASLLIKKGRNINIKDNSDASAIHYAVKKGNENLYKQIMTRGAELKAVDASGNNILFHALEGRNKRIINNLIETNQLDLAHINKTGETAYKIALKNGMQDVAQRISKGRN